MIILIWLFLAAVVQRGITVRSNLLKTLPLEVTTSDTTSPLIIRNSANAVICTITNTGDINTSGTITSGGNSVLTAATVYTKTEVDAKISAASLTSASNITSTNAGGINISTSGNQISLQQSGDALGTSTLTLANRGGQNGVLISTANTTATVTDLVLQTAVASSNRNIRLESRTDFCKTGQHSLQIGASLSAGDNYVNATRLYIGTQPTVNTTPTDLLTVNGTVAFFF